MNRYLLPYGAALLVFLGGDLLWLGWLAKDFYQGQLGPLLLAKPNLWAAAVFYLLYVFGLMVFVILPAIDAQALGKAALYGALFGLIAYGTYDLSNLATLKDWSLAIVFVDMAWGACLTALACSAGYIAAQLA